MSLWVALGWLVAFLLPVCVVFLAATACSRALWRQNPVTAPLYGILGLAGAAWFALLAYWLGPVTGVVVTIAILAASVVSVIVAMTRQRLLSSWRSALPMACLVGGATVFLLAFAFLWGPDTDPYSLVGARFFSFHLPTDNFIPSLFAAKLANGESTHLLIGDWNGGDRPPLQSGFELAFTPLMALIQGVSGQQHVGFGGTMPVGATFALDMIAQLLWIPAGYALLRVLKFRHSAAVGALVFACVVPTLAVNTLFTWPKMLSAALVVTAVTFLLSATRASGARAVWPFVLAVASTAFAVLAHGAAALTIPALVVVGLYALRGRGIGTSVRTMALGGSAGLVIYLPWALYQRFIDPPGDRLLKWHLAGIVPSTPESFIDALIAQYTAISPGEWLVNRVENLRTILGLDQLFEAGPGLQAVIFLRIEDWSSSLFALGPIVLACMIALIASWVALRTRQPLPDTDSARMLVVAGMFLSVAIWTLVMFLPNATIVAQGSHSWMLVFVLVPIAWLFDRWPRLALVALLLQAAGFLAVYSGFVLEDAAPARFSWSAAVITVVALGFLLLVPMCLVRSGNGDGRAPEAAVVVGVSDADTVASRSSRDH